MSTSRRARPTRWSSPTTCEEMITLFQVNGLMLYVDPWGNAARLRGRLHQDRHVPQALRRVRPRRRLCRPVHPVGPDAPFRYRPRDRAADPASGQAARPRAALGPPRRAAPHQEEGRAAGPAGQGDGGGASSGSSSARPAATSTPPIPAPSAPTRAATRARSSWSRTSPTCGRWSAPARSTPATTCSAARCRRSTASGPDDLGIDRLVAARRRRRRHAR